MAAVSDTRRFEPGSLIEIDDVFTGIRKLVRVEADGLTYIDLEVAGTTPFPIYAALRPQEAGNLLSWGLQLVDRQPEQLDAWKALAQALVDSGEDTLTYQRAAYWASRHRVLDVERALAAGREETRRVAEGRAAMDAILERSGDLA